MFIINKGMKSKSYNYVIGQYLDELVSEESKKRIAACENIMEVAKALGKDKTKTVFVPFLKGTCGLTRTDRRRRGISGYSYQADQEPRLLPRIR